MSNKQNISFNILIFYTYNQLNIQLIEYSWLYEYMIHKDNLFFILVKLYYKMLIDIIYQFELPFFVSVLSEYLNWWTPQ